MENKFEAFCVCIGSVLAVFLLVGGCTLFTQGVERNDRDRGIHQTHIKVECIKSGKILINNNCIFAGK